MISGFSDRPRTALICYLGSQQAVNLLQLAVLAVRSGSQEAPDAQTTRKPKATSLEANLVPAAYNKKQPWSQELGEEDAGPDGAAEDAAPLPQGGGQAGVVETDECNKGQIAGGNSSVHEPMKATASMEVCVSSGINHTGAAKQYSDAPQADRQPERCSCCRTRRLLQQLLNRL